MQEKKVYRYLLKLTKSGELKFLSHLDWQNLIIKAFRRCEVKFALSCGFNPMPRIAFSPALPIFLESKAEFVTLRTTAPLDDDFKQKFESNVNQNVRLIYIKEVSDTKEYDSLDNVLQWASYSGKIYDKNNLPISNFEKVFYNSEKCLSSDEFLIEKISKKGIKKVLNYRNSINLLELKEDELSFILKTGQDENIPSLRADEFLKHLFNDEFNFEIKRVCFFDKDFKEV